VNGGCRDGGMAFRDTELVQVGDYVTCRMQALD
jgi:hypothetical protein